MNKLEVGKVVHNLSHGDGGRIPKHYFIRVLGRVSKITDKCVHFGNNITSKEREKDDLIPNQNGTCYYMSEIENIEQYEKVGDYYKVPVSDVKAHTLTYVSPWRE